MNSQTARWIELTVLFMIVPVLLLLPVSPMWLVGLAIIALCYCAFISRNVGLFSKKQLFSIDWHNLAGRVTYLWLIFCSVSTFFMWLLLPESLFKVLLNNPLLWIAICFVYAIFSVYPQEFIYRHFFYARYRTLIKHPALYILLNASLFSLAHIMFLNLLVMILTFAGGILFALTYEKKRSLLLVSVEHSLYGLWLFTLGMGDMLAFPS